MMAEKLGLDEQPHELNLGASFDPQSGIAFHSVRYDFKPASVDPTRMSSIDIGENNSVTITVPHVPGSGATHTVYKGNKRACQKECVLIIDHNTGEITLEKLASTLHTKKTRLDGSSKVQQSFRPVTPVEQKLLKERRSSSPKVRVKASPPPAQKPAPRPPAPATTTMPKKGGQTEGHGDRLSSSASSDSDSDSDSNTNSSSDNEGPEPVKDTRPAEKVPTRVSHAAPTPTEKPISYTSLISDDLRLSESSSDSD